MTSRTEAGLKISVRFDSGLEPATLDGRLLVILSADDGAEPRFQVAPGVDAVQIFGLDVEGWTPDQPMEVDRQVFGYPVPSLAEVPPGEYVLQAVLHRYETFDLATGHTVKLPMDRGEGQQWNRAPGNLYSTPRRQKIDPGRGGQVEIRLDQRIPPIEPPADTPYVRHIRIRSELLSEFWGRPIYLGAHVLLPHGFDEHPDARYPLAVFHGHFPADVSSFRETPPDPDLEPEYSKRFRIDGYNRIEQEEAWRNYQRWIEPDRPRMIVVEIQHANPYYDDSYAVNSANLGPWGDAITFELIPHIERTFRGIGEGWARFLYGGSTGGWEALAAQIFYPDEYNGAFGACPDPVDFRAFTQVDIYEDDNAYHLQGPFQRVYRPGHRDYLGHVTATLQDYNHLELVLGSRGRSGEQFDIWQAVCSPQGDDGYPRPIWDKFSGKIDHEVAEYWREHFDLRHILARDWKTLGPKLAGKLHVYVGTMDNYYLNNAVYLLEEFLKNTRDPHYGGEVDYGCRAEHCWNGDHDNPIWISRLRYADFYTDKIVRRIEASAPPGADLSSWRY
ncbi:MAG: hypothetical protein PVG91_06750 [Gammaproteobacteria bacterium]|jgi:hypothetical protein